MTGITLLFIALFSPPAQPSSMPTNSATMAEAGVVHRGAAFALTDRITMDALAKDAPNFAGKTVQVSGKVSAVCKKKGCWMTLAGDDATARARIRFKDYAFFVPLDADGHQAVVEGVVSVTTLSDAERKHLAEDAGKPVTDIPANELQLMATAVELRRPDAKAADGN